jgi:methylthioribose-1-phosphate isomerase
MRGSPAIRLSAVLGCVLALAAAAAAQTPQEEAARAQALAKRALTDADIEKYIAVRTDITRLGTPRNTAAELQKYAADCKKIRSRHGITDAEYSVLLGRIMTAQNIIRMEKQVPAPGDKKADVEIVRKHLQRIREAEGKKVL